MSIKKMETVENNFGIELRRVRKARKVSVDDLAKHVNISSSYIYKIESMTVIEVAKRTAEQLQFWINSNNWTDMGAEVPLGWDAKSPTEKTDDDLMHEIAIGKILKLHGAKLARVLAHLAEEEESE